MNVLYMYVCMYVCMYVFKYMYVVGTGVLVAACVDNVSLAVFLIVFELSLIQYTRYVLVNPFPVLLIVSILALHTYIHR